MAEREANEAKDDVEVLRERIRTLEEENQALRIQLSSAAANHHRSDDNDEQAQEPSESDSDPVLVENRRLSARLANAEDRASALEAELGRTLREKHELMHQTATTATDSSAPRRRSSRASDNEDPYSDENRDDDYDEAEAERACRSISADVRSDRKRDRRSMARSRSAKETRALRQRVQELEEALASLSMTATAALAKGGAAGIKTSLLPPSSPSSPSVSSSFSCSLAPSYSSSPERGKLSSQVATVPVPDGEGLERHTSRAQMA